MCVLYELTGLGCRILLFLSSETYISCMWTIAYWTIIILTLCSRSVVSILNKAGRKHSRRGRPSRKNLKGDWMTLYLSIRAKALSSLVVWGVTLDAHHFLSLPLGKLQCTAVFSKILAIPSWAYRLFSLLRKAFNGILCSSFIVKSPSSSYCSIYAQGHTCFLYFFFSFDFKGQLAAITHCFMSQLKRRWLVRQ